MIVIVGRGLVASAFQPFFADNDDIVIFAAGVSNSKETRVNEFLREERLLCEVLAAGKCVFYFGSCSILDPEMVNTPYIDHKGRMEQLVRQVEKYRIFRLPQVVGKSSNYNQLTNFLFLKINSGEHFDIWSHARRNFIDVDHVASIVTYLALTNSANSKICNIACPFSTSVVEIVRIFESVLKKTANYSLISAGGSYDIDASEAEQAARALNIDFGNSYVERLIRKYYG